VVPVAKTVVDEGAVVVKVFNASATGVAVK
jgi:hypothetical protein